MALKKKLFEELCAHSMNHLRFYSSRVNFKKIRPMIIQRIRDRAKDYPIESMIPVAEEVLKARALLIEGVEKLIKVVPFKACKLCPEVYIGEEGHLIQTCHGFRRRAKNRVHEWIDGGLKDILVPVEAYHLQNMFQKEIEHDQRFDFDRIPAVVELCLQAGAKPNNENLINPHSDGINTESLSDEDWTASDTLRAYETVRKGVQKLLLVYAAKVCKHCGEVHVGPSGHKARLCGVFKFEAWHGTHYWQKATVDDLVPPKIVWHRRSQDPAILVNEGRNYYGHAPAVIDLCQKAGAVVPSKYNVMMKVQGLRAPSW
ncbi:hypothetical protein ACFE04_017232 [Oxalis oulophora]